MAKSTHQGSSIKLDSDDLDLVFPELARRVKERFGLLKQDVQAKQREMEKLSDQHERLAGKPLMRNGTETSNKPSPRSGRRRKRRTRKQGVTIQWLNDTLSKKPMTVKQLQEAAGKSGLSGLKIAALLRKGKFKSRAGEKQEGVKGKPGAVWSAR